jgi:hypothetical protein
MCRRPLQTQSCQCERMRGMLRAALLSLIRTPTNSTHTVKGPEHPLLLPLTIIHHGSMLYCPGPSPPSMSTTDLHPLLQNNFQPTISFLWECLLMPQQSAVIVHPPTGQHASVYTVLILSLAYPSSLCISLILSLACPSSLCISVIFSLAYPSSLGISLTLT